MDDYWMIESECKVGVLWMDESGQSASTVTDC